MSKNDLLLFDGRFEANRASREPQTPADEFFEFFAAEQILRDLPLDPDEIKAGLVGQLKQRGGSDGGIDSMYVIVNGRMIRDLDQARALNVLRRDVQFDVIFIQSKLGTGFELAPLLRFKDTAESIFDLQKPIEQFAETYNEALLDAIRVFREAHAVLLPGSPNITVHFYYAARADSSAAHSTIKAKALEVEQKIPRLLSTIGKCKVEFIGAKELFEREHKRAPLSYTLPCFDVFSDELGGTLALVEIGEYYKFIAEGDQLKETLFESNVRDYQGDVAINNQIKETLERDGDPVGFWWLNNGITIVSSKVDPKRRSVVIDDPQIVNGLQTSQVIFNHLKNKSKKDDKRLTVVRIIQSPDDAAQDRIIRATNSQTPISAAVLRASDNVQREIEHIFRARGMHYDRRKNSWRKTGLPFSAVVGTTELAQSFAAIVLKEPDHARARPSRYFQDPYYKKVFKETIDLPLYVVCAKLRKRMEVYLSAHESDKKHRNNLLFYCLMVLGFQLSRTRIKGKVQLLKDVDVEGLNDSVFKKAVETVKVVYKARGHDDKAAKGTEMVSDLRGQFSRTNASKGG